MIIYQDYEPKKIRYHAITIGGKEVFIEAYISEDEKYITPIYNYDSKESVRKQEATHYRCEICGEIMDKKEIYFRNSKYICCDCENKLNKESYVALPVVDMKFPIFVGDHFVLDEDALEDYIYEDVITILETTEAHNTNIESLNLDIVDYIDNQLCDNGYEESLEECLSDKEYARIVELEEEIASILQKNISPMYTANIKSRIDLVKEGMKVDA